MLFVVERKQCSSFESCSDGSTSLFQVGDWYLQVETGAQREREREILFHNHCINVMKIRRKMIR